MNAAVKHAGHSTHLVGRREAAHEIAVRTLTDFHSQAQLIVVSTAIAVISGTKSTRI